MQLRKVYATPGRIINIGRAGEHGATEVIFDISEWAVKNIGNVQLIVNQNGLSYPQVLDTESDNNDKVIWKVNSSNTSAVGLGKCELFYTEEDIVVKSSIFDIIVTASLDYGQPENVPDPYSNWVTKLYEALDEVQRALSELDVEGLKQIPGLTEEDKIAAEAAAQSARESMNTAAGFAIQAQTASVKTPYIENGNWQIYNADEAKYEDSGFIASIFDGIVETANELVAGNFPVNSTILITGTIDSITPNLSPGDIIEIVDDSSTGAEQFTENIYIKRKGTIRGPQGASGTGIGDMVQDEYDPDGVVKSDKGIPDYVTNRLAGYITTSQADSTYATKGEISNFITFTVQKYDDLGNPTPTTTTTTEGE